MKTPDLKPCPYCGGNAKLSFKDYAFGGYNSFGEKRLKYRVQVICNKCHSRGKPIITEWLINPNPHAFQWHDEAYVLRLGNGARVKMEMFRPFIEQAIDAWNRRVTDEP